MSKKYSSELLKEKAQKAEKETQTFFARLKKRPPKKLDEIVHQLHDEVFEEIDCLDCANCCQSISPIVTTKDISRISKWMKMKEADFIERYLQIDAEQDYVFRTSPCPFLGAGHYCDIYELRPKACREYPHTDRRRFVQLLDLSRKNCHYCPAVFEVVEKMKQHPLLKK